jgi:hypothetical protein
MATDKLELREQRLGTITLRGLILTLTVATAVIHATLGGVLFTMNAFAFGTLAVAFVLPEPIARARWLVRVAILGFAAATIAGWLVFGARFPLAYLDKAIELALVVAVAIDLMLTDGGPLEIARRLLRLPSDVVRFVADVVRS